MVGRVYLAKIYFTDLSDYKIRPVLIVKDLDEDCICLPLTTQHTYPGIMISSDDFLEGTLKRESMVVFPKSITLHKKILIRHLGTISTEKFKVIFSAFCSSLGCGDI